MRKLTLLAIVLMVALVAVPAFASVQNVKVSGSVDSSYLYREDFDLGLMQVNDEKQNLFMTQTKLRVDADLTDQVSATVALINERAWGNENTSDTTTDVDLHLAYVTLREMLYSPLTVVAGRQEFKYGNSLVIDTGGSSIADSGIINVASDLSKQHSMDAIRLIFDYNPLTLEALWAKVDSNDLILAADDKDDVDLWGLNASYELGDELNTQIEGYFFAKVDKNVAGLQSKSDTVYVPGLRASADILDGLNVQGELAWQKGNRVATTATEDDNEKRDAMAAQFIGNYQVPNDVLPDELEKYNPSLQYIYTYVSGDSNPNDRRAETEASSNKYTAWDPMFENQSGGKIYNSLFNLTNAHIQEVSLKVKPIEDVTTKLGWTGLWLDKELNDNDTIALLQPDGGTAAIAWEEDETYLGCEIDWDTVYDYTEDVQIGASFGWFNPGDVFDSDNEKTASQAILHANVNF